jgi:integrase
MYYKLTLANNKLTATRINKSDVSPYAHITYVDKFVNNLLENGYPNRNKIVDFIDSYDMVNSISATRSMANMLVNGERVTVTGYTVNDSNYFKVRDIAMLLRKIRFHDLRHTCASLMHKMGLSPKEVQDYLGHSTVSVTLNIYTHLDWSSKENAAKAMENAVKLPENVQIASKWES